MANPDPKKPKHSAFNRDVFFKGIRAIRNCLAPHRSLLIALIGVGLLSAIAQAFVPLISGKIFDAIIGIAHDPAAAIRPVLIFIGVWLILQIASNALGWWSGIKNNELSAMVEAEYISRGFGKLFLMPLGFHASQKQGDVGDRISRAAGWLDNIMSNVVLTLIPNFLSIVVAFTITTFISWKLSLVFIIAIIAYVLILWKSVPALSGLQQKMHRAYNRAFGDAYDALGNLKEIKQAATETQEQKKVQTNFIDRAAQFWADLSTIFQRLTFIQKMLVTLTQLAVFTISIFLVRDGSITPGDLVAFNAYAAMILGPFVIIGQNWQVVQNGLVAIVRAEKILNSPTETYTPQNAVVLKKLKGDIVFDNVVFAYKKVDTAVLKGISFHAEPGQKVALVGESGVGKTTLIDLITGFYFPQKGKILIDGTDIKRLDLTAYRSRIGVVPQEPALFNDTVLNNIRYGNPGKSNAEVIAATEEAYAHDFIEAFPKKYRQMVGWRGIKLSIGQKQRIALARAFLRNPDILILDEPTSALDAKSEDLIKNALQKLMEGRTTFIIAHRLSTVRTADVILVFKKGKIVEQGNHKTLMRIPSGIYRNLYNLQNGLRE